MFVDGFPGPDIVRDSIQLLPQGFEIVTFWWNMCFSNWRPRRVYWILNSYLIMRYLRRFVECSWEISVYRREKMLSRKLLLFVQWTYRTKVWWVVNKEIMCCMINYRKFSFLSTWLHPSISFQETPYFSYLLDVMSANVCVRWFTCYIEQPFSSQTDFYWVRHG